MICNTLQWINVVPIVSHAVVGFVLHEHLFLKSAIILRCALALNAPSGLFA